MAVTYQYIRQSSALHSMDPLSKALWLMVVSAIAFLFGSPLLVAVQLLATIATGLVLGRVHPRTFLRGTSVIFSVALAGFTFQVLFVHRGPTLLELGPFTLNAEGVRLGLLVGIRVALLSVAALVFIWTTNPRDLIVALVHVGVPYRPAYALFVALQFVPLLEQEARIIREAHAVRGVSDVSGRFESWKRYLVPLLAYAIRKAEAAAIAMDSRAFGAYKERAFVDEFHWTRSGLVFVATFLVFDLTLLLVAIQGDLLSSYGAF
jgi:energy-coupling factor transport system permease protein